MGNKKYDLTQQGKNPVKLTELLLAKRELTLVAKDARTHHLARVEFMQGFCCHHLLDRTYFSKPGFDKCANGKLWVCYTDSTGRQLREHVGGWVEMKHTQARISAREYPGYFIPGRFFTRKQSNEESLREFLIVRKDFLLLDLFIHAKHGAQPTLIKPISVPLVLYFVAIADRLSKVVAEAPVVIASRNSVVLMPPLWTTHEKSSTKPPIIV